MKMKKMKKLLLITTFLSILIFSCVKRDDFDRFSKIKGIELDGTYGIALFNDKIAVEDFFGELSDLGQIIVNPDGYLSYIAGAFSTSLIGNEYIQIPNQNLNGTISFPNAAVNTFNAAPVGSSVQDSASETWSFNITSIELDSLIYKAGALVINVNSSFTIPISISFKIEDLYRANGAVYQETINVPALSTRQANLNLTGCKSDFTLKGTDHSKLKVTTTISASKSNITDNISIFQNLSFTLDIQNQEFSKIFGYFGQQGMNFPTSTLALSLFNNTSSTGSGNINIVDPRINLYFDNSFGMDIQINTISPFLGRTEAGSTINITGFSLPLTLNRPTVFGGISRTPRILKEPEVNLKTLADAPVKEIDFGASASINPGGVTKNYALDTSRVVLITEIEIPFHGTLNDLQIESSTSFTPPEQADIIDFVEIKLIVENTLPLGLHFQIYFTDDNDVAKDSLFKTVDQQNLIPASSINTQGITTNAGVKTSILRMDQALLKKLKDADVKNIRIKVRANSSQGGSVPVKIFPEYGITLKAGMRTRIKGEVSND
jgi:hypothetical protein